MQGIWIRKPSGPTTVVFIHGFLSDGESCWRHENGTYWPELLSKDETLPAIGVYVFTYKTDFFSGSYRLGDVVDSFKEHAYLDKIFDSQNVILVCHSMGGIVARKFITTRAADLIARGTNLAVFLLASPSLGSAYASWLRPLAKLLRHTQADALRFSQNNAWLAEGIGDAEGLKIAYALASVGLPDEVRVGLLRAEFWYYPDTMPTEPPLDRLPKKFSLSRLPYWHPEVTSKKKLPEVVPRVDSTTSMDQFLEFSIVRLSDLPPDTTRAEIYDQLADIAQEFTMRGSNDYARIIADAMFDTAIMYR
jgi:pimeloyl-ACP methyl ester carboxylesterase